MQRNLTARCRRLAVAVTASLAVSLAGLAGSASAQNYDWLLPPYGTCGTAAEGDMTKSYQQWTTGAMCLVNVARENAGLADYGTDMSLLDSAYHKASDISVCQPNPFDSYAVHHACGQPTDKWITWPRACASSGWAENVYIGYGASSTPRAAVRAWLNSDAHRAALLSPNYTSQGLMYSGPTAYPGEGPDTRIWVHHMRYCT